MKYFMYCLYDRKTSNFYPPMLHENDADAMRSFEQLCSNKNIVYGFAPSDFTLYKVGTFETKTGRITADGPCEGICNGSDFA